jgi:hypothetical protein
MRRGEARADFRGENDAGYSSVAHPKPFRVFTGEFAA